ncbi:MAG TPA: cellulase family glycosylhydrolase [Solirubrobacterales bacterium]
MWGPVLAAMAACLLVLPAAAGAESKSSRDGGTLGHVGRFITDSDGRVVTLHGVNMVNKIQSSGYAPDAIRFGRDDARFLARNGLNVVRLGIIWKGLEPQPGVYDDAYLDRIMRTYRLLHRQGIAVLLDFHQDMYNERFQGEGAPDWAVVGQAATEPATPRTGFPANYVLQNALNHAYDAFWANAEVPGTGRGVQDLYAAAWAHVAKRFRGKPGIVGYNLFNEPWMGTPLQQCALAGGGTSPDSCGIKEFEATTLTAFHRRVTRAIRRVDKRTMVFPAPILTFDFGGVTGVGRVSKRAGFAFNAYCGQADPLIGALVPYLAGKPCSFSADLSLSHALDESRRNGDALFMTEMGATDDLANFADYLNGANALGISWTYWAYTGFDPTTTGAGDTQALVLDPSQPPAGANVKTEKLALLAQPYAMVTAGTPRRWGFDPATRSFRYVYRTKPAGQGRKFGPGSISTLSVPAIEYPAGYRVRVRGARVVSRPRARVLRIAQCGRAKRVKVSVAPGKFRGAAQKCG